jgi:Tfp pilus assembly protein PilZ
MADNQQGYPRANIKWPVVVKSAKKTMEGVTSNVTPNGVFIHCQHPLRLNEIFDMDISIPNSDQSLNARAEVIWSNIYGPDDDISPRGMGVRFLRISSEARKFIARAALEYLQSKKIAPELLQTLSTLTTDLNEVKSKVA